MKYNKRIYAICLQCAKQIYPPHIINSDKLSAITVSKNKCCICRIIKICIPIKDFWYACGNNNSWD